MSDKVPASNIIHLGPCIEVYICFQCDTAWVGFTSEPPHGGSEVEQRVSPLWTPHMSASGILRWIPLPLHPLRLLLHLKSSLCHLWIYAGLLIGYSLHTCMLLLFFWVHYTLLPLLLLYCMPFSLIRLGIVDWWSRCMVTWGLLYSRHIRWYV